MLYITVDHETKRTGNTSDGIGYAREQYKLGKNVVVINKLDGTETVIDFNDSKYDIEAEFYGINFSEMQKKIRNNISDYAKNQGTTIEKVYNDIAIAERKQHKKSGNILVKTV
jgi:hypothetical protein